MLIQLPNGDWIDHSIIEEVVSRKNVSFDFDKNELITKFSPTLYVKTSKETIWIAVDDCDDAVKKRDQIAQKVIDAGCHDHLCPYDK